MPCHGAMTAMMTTPVNGLTLNELERRGEMRWRAEEHAWVAMSEDAVRSIVSMLAEQGKVRIAVVELPQVAWSAGPLRHPLASVPTPDLTAADTVLGRTDSHR